MLYSKNFCKGKILRNFMERLSPQKTMKLWTRDHRSHTYWFAPVTKLSEVRMALHPYFRPANALPAFPLSHQLTTCRLGVASNTHCIQMFRSTNDQNFIWYQFWAILRNFAPMKFPTIRYIHVLAVEVDGEEVMVHVVSSFTDCTAQEAWTCGRKCSFRVLY